MKKNVLFIGPKVANIYLDIIAELERQDYYVDFYEYKSYKRDPNNLKGHVKYGKIFVPEKSFNKFIEEHWIQVLNSSQYSKVYDFLFVLDGDSLHSCIFDILRCRNPKVRTINYLFDSTHSSYQFNVNFKYFDKVYTFDIGDSNKYGVNLLPIFWQIGDSIEKQNLDLFGMGAYIESRYYIYSALKHYSEKNNLKSFIKIYTPIVKFTWKNYLKKKFIEALGYNSYMIPCKHYNSDLITHDLIPTDEYMNYIKRSRIIIDSVAPHQDGLTARFMWALGAERKIITNNESVYNYDFYSENQIYVIKNINDFVDDPKFNSFISSDFKMDNNMKLNIQKYRIDNWIKTLFE